LRSQQVSPLALSRILMYLKLTSGRRINCKKCCCSVILSPLLLMRNHSPKGRRCHSYSWDLHLKVRLVLRTVCSSLPQFSRRSKWQSYVSCIEEPTLEVVADRCRFGRALRQTNMYKIAEYIYMTMTSGW
jgi:hypothetical protein